jgi:hypothetical protein
LTAPGVAQSETVPNSECPTGGIDLASDAQGGLVLLLDGGPPPRVDGIRAATRSSIGRFSPAVAISRPSDSANFAGLGASRSGKAIAAWTMHDGRDRARGVSGAVRRPNGHFKPNARRISNKRWGSFEDLAVSPRGHGLVVWQDTRRRGGVGSLWTAAMSARSIRFRKATRIPGSLPRNHATLPQAAIDRSGRSPLVAWSRPGPSGERGVFVTERRGPHRKERRRSKK